MSNRLPLVIAHRGASGYRPEHTRSAYELAIELGADAVEPDIVATRDGVLVVRHENEISQTTDVDEHPEFADRRTSKTIDGVCLTGWFTEDFTWAELSTLRAKERLPQLRPSNTAFDRSQPVFRLSELLSLIDDADRSIGLVAEIKHASYFDSIGLPLDRLFAAELARAGWTGDPRLTVESFEQTVLGQVHDRGVGGRLVFLAEADGAPADQVAIHGEDAKSYAAYLEDEGLARLASDGIDGISIDKVLLLPEDAGARVDSGSSERSRGGELVRRAHAAGLTAFCWTLRAENQFLPETLRSGIAPAAYGDWMTEFQYLMRCGLDGVFADQPDLEIAARSTL